MRSRNGKSERIAGNRATIRRLRKRQPVRLRPDEFYEKQGVEESAWQAKVDMMLPIAPGATLETGPGRVKTLTRFQQHF